MVTNSFGNRKFHATNEKAFSMLFWGCQCVLTRFPKFPMCFPKMFPIVPQFCPIFAWPHHSTSLDINCKKWWEGWVGSMGLNLFWILDSHHVPTCSQWCSTSYSQLHHNSQFPYLLPTISTIVNYITRLKERLHKDDKVWQAPPLRDFIFISFFCF
jgi:hypothetical protein